MAEQFGAEYIEHTPASLEDYTHAEKYLYAVLKQRGFAPDTIGISHRDGPCPSCRKFFSNEDTDVLIHWNDNKKEGWMR